MIQSYLLFSGFLMMATSLAGISHVHPLSSASSVKVSAP